MRPEREQHAGEAAGEDAPGAFACVGIAPERASAERDQSAQGVGVMRPGEIGIECLRTCCQSGIGEDPGGDGHDLAWSRQCGPGISLAELPAEQQLSGPEAKPAAPQSVARVGLLSGIRA